MRNATLLATLLALPLSAQPPIDYYITVDDSNPSTLRATLHDVIDDHTCYPYTSTSTAPDTWDILELADEDIGNPSNIIDVYKNESYAKVGGGNPNYNREHAWPNSYGFPINVVANIPYTDMHALFLCDGGYNSSRGNTLYRTCGSGCSERVTVLNNGVGGGSGVYPGNSNWREGTGNTGTWEVWVGKRGDIARALFYMDVRYEGSPVDVNGNFDEPELVLTNDETLIVTSSVNIPVAYMGILHDLLTWHEQDPVDDRERARNEVVYVAQGNRNPFIDEPLWVRCVYEGVCLEVDLVFEDGFETGDLSSWAVE